MTAKLITTVLILFAASAFASGGTPGIVVIDIKQNAVVNSDIVLLKHIAAISGDSETGGLLGNVSLGYAPQIGSVRPIPIRKIRLVIAAAGVPSRQLKLVAPEIVYVRRSGQPVEREAVRKAIETAITDVFPKDGFEIKIAQIQIPDAGEVPEGTLEVLPQLKNIRNLFEPFSLPLEIRVGSKLVGRIAAQVEIEAFAEVLTAAEDIPGNTRITPGQLVLSKRRITKPIGGYLRRMEDVRGIRSSREIRRGDEITRDSFVADIVVKNGDRVRIVGVSGRLQLSVNGVAQAGGRIGDRIAVKNLQSGNILQGIIADEGIVSVFF